MEVNNDNECLPLVGFYDPGESKCKPCHYHCI